MVVGVVVPLRSSRPAGEGIAGTGSCRQSDFIPVVIRPYWISGDGAARGLSDGQAYQVLLEGRTDRLIAIQGNRHWTGYPTGIAGPAGEGIAAVRRGYELDHVSVVIRSHRTGCDGAARGLSDGQAYQVLLEGRTDRLIAIQGNRHWTGYPTGIAGPASEAVAAVRRGYELDHVSVVIRSHRTSCDGAARGLSDGQAYQVLLEGRTNRLIAI